MSLQEDAKELLPLIQAATDGKGLRTKDDTIDLNGISGLMKGSHFFGISYLKIIEPPKLRPWKSSEEMGEAINNWFRSNSTAQIKRYEKTDWNLRFIKLAQHIAGWSKDDSTKVGAVIVDPKRRVIGIGFNGFPRGVEDLQERYSDKPTKYAMVVHAECNALLSVGRSVEGCSLYVSSLPPCSQCAAAIIQAGIKSVFCIDSEVPERWKQSCDTAFLMFKEAGVEVFKVNMEE